MTEHVTDIEMRQPELLSHLWVLDLDRTILDTDKFQQSFTQFLDFFNVIDIGHLRQMQVDVQASGGSFDTLGYLQSSDAHRVEPLRLGTLLEDFVDWVRPQADALYEPQARELLSYLDQLREPYIFMTKGGRQWQELKFRALGLEDIPRIITDQTDKTVQLAGVYRGGAFVIDAASGLTGGPAEGIRTRTYTIIDDKVESVRGIRNDARTRGLAMAIHVLPADGRELLPSQRGDLPDGVRRFVGAAGVQRYIAMTRSASGVSEESVG